MRSLACPIPWSRHRPTPTPLRALQAFYGSLTPSMANICRPIRPSRPHTIRTRAELGGKLAQYPAQQATGSLYVTRAEEGGYAVETVLPGAQHRETGTSRVRAVGKEGGISSPDARRHHRLQEAAADQFKCMKKQNGEAMASVGVRVEPPVRRCRCSKALYCIFLRGFH